jgi:hypothetical protein
VKWGKSERSQRKGWQLTGERKKRKMKEVKENKGIKRKFKLDADFL